MKSALVRSARALSDRWELVREIPVDRCYHYRGFRYGGFGHNPYEDFILGLSRGEDLLELRRAFAQTTLTCRPRGWGAALQIELANWPLWEFPWQRASGPPSGEVDELEDNPDVVTHYCAKGVLVSQINREFNWLEGAWRNIQSSGYQPRRFGHIRCIELRRHGVPSSYIVLDGNHRLSALHAKGALTVEVRVPWLRTVTRSRVAAWPRVRDGSLSQTQALMIFDRYFRRTNPPLIAQNPASLIADEAPLWPIETPVELTAA